jgi:hypothetical protein
MIHEKGRITSAGEDEQRHVAASTVRGRQDRAAIVFVDRRLRTSRTISLRCFFKFSRTRRR